MLKLLPFYISGKYPHLSVTCCGLQDSVLTPMASFPSRKETIINFGTVPIGQTVGGWFEIVNLSQVMSRDISNRVCQFFLFF